MLILWTLLAYVQRLIAKVAQSRNADHDLGVDIWSLGV